MSWLRKSREWLREEMTKTNARWGYIFENHYLHLITALLLAILVALFINFTDRSIGSVWWWNMLFDSFIGVLTFLIAIFIWWTEMSHEWESRLPKKLDVDFMGRDEKGAWVKVMRCENAPLFAEQDIRAWAQQVGRQMNNNDYLEFFPYIDYSPADLCKEEEGGWHLHYSVKMYLLKEPSKLDKEKMKTQFYLWRQVDTDELFEGSWEIRNDNM